MWLEQTKRKKKKQLTFADNSYLLKKINVTNSTFGAMNYILHHKQTSKTIFLRSIETIEV